MDIIFKGISAEINITLEDIDETALNLSTLNDIWVKVYHKYSKVEMDSFQYTVGTVTIVDAEAGKLKVILNDNDTDEKQTGIYTGDVKTSETDTDYDSNTRYRGASGDIFILKKLEV